MKKVILTQTCCDPLVVKVSADDESQSFCLTFKNGKTIQENNEVSTEKKELVSQGDEGIHD
jgi:hypothetical protein